MSSEKQDGGKPVRPPSHSIDLLFSEAPTDASMALCAHQLLPGAYQYRGEQQWYYKDASGKWKKDPLGKWIFEEVQLHIGQAVMERAYFWESQKSPLSHKSVHHYDCERMIKQLIKAKEYLNRPNLRISLLEEMKIYYVVEQ